MLTLPLNTDLALTKSAKKKNSTFVLTLVAAAVLSGFSATSIASTANQAHLNKSDVLLLDTASVITPRVRRTYIRF